MLSELLKQEIDSMSYQQMVELWRSAPIGSALFQGEAGTYFEKMMEAKKETIVPSVRAQISKIVGWKDR